MKDELDKAWAEFVLTRQEELVLYGHTRADAVKLFLNSTAIYLVSDSALSPAIRKFANIVQQLMSSNTTIQFIPNEGCLVAGVMMFLYPKSA